LALTLALQLALEIGLTLQLALKVGLRLRLAGILIVVAIVMPLRCLSHEVLLLDEASRAERRALIF
jgi:hypothetical protein